MTDWRTQPGGPELKMRETSMELEDLPENQHQTPVHLFQSHPESPNRMKVIWTKYWKHLLVIALFLLAVFLGILYYTFTNRGGDRTTAPPCLSAACDWASQRLSSSVDPFAQPCDYFLFPCEADKLTSDNRGRAEQTQNRSEGSALENTEQNTRRRSSLLRHLRQILESIDMNSSLVEQQTKTFYSSCLDTGAIETAGVEPFLHLIQTLGGWAVSGHLDHGSLGQDLNSTLALLMRSYATFPFFKAYVDQKDVHGSSKPYIQIDEPDLLIPIKWNYEKKKTQIEPLMMRQFMAMCQRYLTLLGAQAQEFAHVGSYMSLSSKLTVAAVPPQYRLSKGQLYQRMSIKELQLRAPDIDWLTCLQTTFDPVSLTEDDEVIVHNLAFIENMSLIIREWRDKPETINIDPLRTFMILNLLHTMMPAMDSRFTNASKVLSVARKGKDEPRWELCVTETGKGFNSVLTHLLSQQRAAIREAQEVVQSVFSAFKSTLQQLKLTNERRRVLTDQVNSLTPKLWTSSETLSEEELDRRYSTVSVQDHSFFSNYASVLFLRQQRQSSLLIGRGVPVDVLSVTPRLLGKELLVPMGLFVPPLFHPTYPRAMNYGLVGFLLAKDLLHLLLPNIHSQSETVREVAGCVWTHYLTVTDRKGGGGGGTLTAAQQQEVWLQYTALQMALQAYQLNLRTRPVDTSVSGLAYTRLFLSTFSQMTCDLDPPHRSMPLEPSFLITVFCAGSDLCPSRLQCPQNAQQHSLEKC